MDSSSITAGRSTASSHQTPASSVAGADSPVRPLQLVIFGSEDHSVGTILFLADDAPSRQTLISRCQFLQSDFPIISTEEPIPSGISAGDFARRLANALREKRAKRLSVIAFGECAAVALHLAIAEREIVRRVLLVDPLLRGPVTFRERLLLAVERFIPMGLPIYREPGDFDTRPALHRLRCPTWLVRTTAGEVRKLPVEHRIPNLRIIPFQGSGIAPNGVLDANFVRIVRDFIAVPAKRSQKGLSERA